MTEGYETVRDAGPEAPWLTLVHAMTQDHRVFSAQVNAFRDRFNILLVDLPGHGWASQVPGPFGHLEMMAHLRFVLDESRVGPTHLWATHTGTAVALLLAAREPQRFASLVLEGAVISGFPMPYVTETLAKAAQTARDQGIEAAISTVFWQAAWYDVMRANPVECRAEAHWQILKDFKGAPWIELQPPAPAQLSDDELKALSVPTLVYNGAHDVSDFMDVAARLQQLMPAARSALIADAGGFPAWEYPERVNAAVAAFLDQQG